MARNIHARPNKGREDGKRDRPKPLPRKETRAQEPKGRVIYRNPNAVPVKGKRTLFALENVEWISISETSTFRPPRGYRGIVSEGRIKFKGVRSSRSVVVKQCVSGGVDHIRTISGIIERIRKSGVPHPKMEFLNTRKPFGWYIIMEPFLRVETKTKQKVSKFIFSDECLMRTLDVKNPEGRRLFEEGVRIAGRLSKAGLFIRLMLDLSGPILDSFNAIKLRDGSKKLFIQDLDCFLIDDANLERNFWRSAKMLEGANGVNFPQNQAIVRKTILKVAGELGFKPPADFS